MVKSGHQVTMLDIDTDRVQRIKEEGLRVEGISGEGTVPVEIVLSPGEVGKPELVILCVKSYDTEEAIQSVAPFLKVGTIVLTVQNGLGNVEKIARVVGRDKTLGGITAQGATDLGLGKIRHAGKGETIIGSLTDTSPKMAKEIAYVFTKAGIETKVTDDLEGTIWSKLVINSVINPLTAILNVKNGELLDYHEIRELMGSIVEEAVKVVRAKRVTLQWGDPLAQAERVCKATAENYSSMLQDILNHKKTEIDFINGAIAREGEALGIPTPVNATLTWLVKAIEAFNMKK